MELGGETLAQRGVAMLQDGGADPVILVTGAVPVTIPEALAVHNPDWSTGMGSSLATGLRALAETDADAAVVALADQPRVGAEAVRRLIAAYRDGASVAVAAYDGTPRNPVLIARGHWPAVIELATGDTGARAFLGARPELVTHVECADTGSPDDVDTAEDLARDADGRAWVHLEGDGAHTGLWMDASYGWLQVFTSDGLEPEHRRTALAVEPMTCPPNAFVSGIDRIRLAPGEAVTHRWGLRSLD